jgi:hypothetical protein
MRNLLVYPITCHETLDALSRGRKLFEQSNPACGDTALASFLELEAYLNTEAGRAAFTEFLNSNG